MNIESGSNVTINITLNFPQNPERGIDELINSPRIRQQIQRALSQIPIRPPPPSSPSSSSSLSSQHRQQQQQQQQQLSREPIFRRGGIGIVVAKVLYDLGGFDRGHAISEHKIIVNSRNLTKFVLSGNPGSSLEKFSTSTKRAVHKAIDDKLIDKVANGYFLTPQGKEVYEKRILSLKQGSDGHIVDCSRKRQHPQQDKHSNDEEDFEKESEEDEEEEEEEDIRNEDDVDDENNDNSIKNLLYVLTLYLLRQGNYHTLGFTQRDIQNKKAEVKEMFSRVHFNENENVLRQNISGNYIRENGNKLILSAEGVDIAEAIFTKYTEGISLGQQQPPKKKKKKKE